MRLPNPFHLMGKKSFSFKFVQTSLLLLGMMLGSLPESRGAYLYSNKIHHLKAIAQASINRDIREVTVVGRGENYNKAAQNAAKNALIEVVGSFLDAQTLVNKKTIIEDGLIERTKEIRVDISEYSQGSIQSMEIINTYEENALSVVIAKVRVRINDFRRYIQKLSSGSTEVAKSIFASVAVDMENKDQMMKIFLSKLIKPVAEGKVFSIQIGEPMFLEQFFNSPYCLTAKSRTCEGKGTTDFNPSKALIMPASVSLDPAFKSNLINTLDNMSSEKIVHTSLTDRGMRELLQVSDRDDHVTAIFTKKPLSLTIYVLPSLSRHAEETYKPIYGNTVSILTSFNRNYKYECGGLSDRCPDYYFNHYAINLRGINQEIISSLKMHPRSLSSSNEQMKAKFIPRNADLYRPGMPGIGLLSGGAYSPVTVFSTQRKFWLVLEVNIELLGSAKSISIDYLNQ